MSLEEKNSKVPLIVTIATAVVAVAAVVLLLIFKGADKEPDDSGSSAPSEIVFSATSELYTECETEAAKLVGANYEVIRLFVTEGLPLRKVYGSTDELIDGYYVIDSDKYTEFSQIEALVKSIYTNTAAEKIFKGADGIQIYEDHNVHGDVFFGMNAAFSLDRYYDTDWSNCYIVVEPKSADTCELTVYVNGVTEETASDIPGSVLKIGMVKTSEGWRLDEFLK